MAKVKGKSAKRLTAAEKDDEEADGSDEEEEEGEEGEAGGDDDAESSEDDEEGAWTTLPRSLPTPALAQRLLSTSCARAASTSSSLQTRAFLASRHRLQDA